MVRTLLYTAAAMLVLAPAAILFSSKDTGVAAASVKANPPYAQAVAGDSDAVGHVPAEKRPEPAPPPAPATPVWEKAAELEQAVAEKAAGFPGRYSVVVHDLRSGHQWGFNETARYHPASTIKLPVTLYALEQKIAGNLKWSDTFVYTEEDFESPGAGAFETAPYGGHYTVENLVGRALRYSNNVAVNILGRNLGWNNIRSWSQTINGELYRRLDGMPEVTPESELGWWLHLYRLSQKESADAELILQPLREVDYHGRITAGLPEGVTHVHKFGSFDGNYHDGGIVFLDRPYILIVMTHGAEIGEADRTIAAVSAAVYTVMSQRSGQ